MNKRTKGFSVAAAAAAMVGSTLLPVSGADAATSSISVSPASTTVGSVITITSACTEDLAGGSWLPAQVGLYFPNAFTDMYGKRSTFVSVSTAVGAGGAVVAKVTIPATGTYTTGTTMMPGPEVTKAVAGKIGVDVVCTNSLSATPWQIVSKVDAVTVAARPALMVRAKPAISGKKKKGATLTTSLGRWTPVATSYSFQWKRAGKAIAKATKRTYKVKKADKGKKLTVAVTATRSGYRPTTSVSAAVRIKR